MVDISRTVEAKSDQLNADDLIAGPRTVTVTEVRGNDAADQPVSIFFEGDNGKPYKPCLSMRRVLLKVWGADGRAYVGRSMTLYLDPTVMFGGVRVGGIRISHMSHIDKPQAMMLTTTRSKRAEYTVSPLAADKNDAIWLVAVAAADKGTEAFRAWWNTADAKKARGFLQARLDDLKARAAQADEASTPLSQRLAQDTPAEPEAPPTDQEAPPPEPSDDSEEAHPAHQAGVEAFEDGKSLDQSPHQRGSEDDVQWRLGYTSAKQAAEA
jgi:hypothetical protein